MFCRVVWLLGGLSPSSAIFFFDTRVLQSYSIRLIPGAGVGCSIPNLSYKAQFFFIKIRRSNQEYLELEFLCSTFFTLKRIFSV